MIAAVVLLAAIGAMVFIMRRSRPTTPPLPAAAAAKAGLARLTPADPEWIGPYRPLARLGAGGMGRVYLGRSPGGRIVAIKMIHLELAEDPEFRRRFAAEVAAARKVGGFHTAQVVDADTGATPPWLATAYTPGPSLHELVREHGPLPAGSVTVLAAGLAEGLTAVHTHQIVHRDLKPGNILLAADGPRLIDFGIARALDATSHTRTSTVMGTAAFMSPEQVTGAEVGPASDVFSLGCVLAFAATGRSPFGEGPAHALTHRIVYDEPDLSGLTGPLKDLVAACLSKEPADRPTPQVLLDDLAGPGPHRAEGAWLPDAITEVITLHTTRVQALDTPTPIPHAEPVRDETAKKARRRRGWWKGPVAGLALLALPSTAVVLYDGGTSRFSAWVDYALTEPGVRGLDVRDCAADVDGSWVEVPCESADAEYRVVLQQHWPSDSPGPSDPSESCEDSSLVSEWDRAVETPSYNLCLVRIP